MLPLVRGQLHRGRAGCLLLSDAIVKRVAVGRANILLHGHTALAKNRVVAGIGEDVRANPLLGGGVHPERDRERQRQIIQRGRRIQKAPLTVEAHGDASCRICPAQPFQFAHRVISRSIRRDVPLPLIQFPPGTQPLIPELLAGRRQNVGLARQIADPFDSDGVLAAGERCGRQGHRHAVRSQRSR